MSEQQTSEFLEIPENIPLRWEIFKGFGMQEASRTLIVAAPFVVGAILYAQLSTNPIRILSALFTSIIGFFVGAGLFMKQSYNLSIFDYFLYAWHFSREQQQFDNIQLEAIILETEEPEEIGSTAVSQY